MYDVGIGGEFPVMNFHEHRREAFAVAWSPVTKDTFASSSWDGTVKIVCPTLGPYSPSAEFPSPAQCVQATGSSTNSMLS